MPANLSSEQLLELGYEIFLEHAAEHLPAEDIVDITLEFEDRGAVESCSPSSDWSAELAGSAIQDWIEAVKTWPLPPAETDQRDRELLLVRSRDVLEHIERVIHHVDRLERSAETAVQMHFSVQGNRTNDTMKTLTALTAVFLPLNLVTGFFGMNFEFLPLIHAADGLWWAVSFMLLVGCGLAALFWRKRYLANSGH